MGWYGEWKPYVSVAKRRATAAAFAAKLAKKEKRTLAPVKIEGKRIVQSFWGQAWCENLESYSDFENRLPRGRTYVRNGSVIDLVIERGNVRAIVSGSEVYRISVSIKTLPKSAWKCIRRDCSRSIDSLIDLLRGRFDQGVMQRLSRRDGGLFPQPAEIQMKCSCPDWAAMCKHVAAVLYGIGARLDVTPELLFTLRDVDHLELIHQAVAAENLDETLAAKDGALAGSDLGEIFGIELDTSADSARPGRPRRRRAANDQAATTAASSDDTPDKPPFAARRARTRAKAVVSVGPRPRKRVVRASKPRSASSARRRKAR